MAKSSDSERFAVDVTPPTMAEQSDTPDTPRLRKVPAAVDEQDLAIIRRAVTLWNATAGYCEVDDPARNGHAIADICEKWLLAESARLRAKGQP